MSTTFIEVVGKLDMLFVGVFGSVDLAFGSIDVDFGSIDQDKVYKTCVYTTNHVQGFESLKYKLGNLILPCPCYSQCVDTPLYKLDNPP